MPASPTTPSPASSSPPDGRRPRVLASLAAVALLAWACGDAEGPGAGADGSDAPVRGGTAVVGLSTGAGTLLPPLARTAVDGQLSDILFPGLNRPRWGEGGLTYPRSHPLALAEGWTFGPDSTALTYRLKDGLEWSDGGPLTATDVAFTYRLLSNPEAGLPLSYVTRHMDSVSVHGDTAVTFHFARRYPGMLFDTGAGVLPEHVYGDIPPDRFTQLAGQAGRGGQGGNGGGGAPADQEDVAPGGLVVSGPFRLAAWERGDRIVLVRNPRGVTSPRLDTLVFRVLPEASTRMAELRAGGLDLAEVTSFHDARRLQERSGIRLLRMPRRAYDYVAWNPAGHPAFRDRRVREALSLAIDRQGILEALEMDAFAEPATGPYGPLFPQLRAEPDPPAHRPDRAARLLDEAGWPRSGGESVRARDGRELAFELAVPAGNDRRSGAAELIQAQLARVGVRAEIRTQEFNSLFGRMRQGDYEAALLGWQVGLNPDISPFWYTPDAPLNVVAYDNPDVRAQMDSALAAPTAEEAAPHWRRAARTIVQDHPYAFLWYFDLLHAAGPRLRGAEGGVLGFARDVHEWWVRDDL